MYQCILFIAYIYVLVLGERHLSPIILTQQGSVRGLISDEGDYYSYKGISYATVKHRFQGPGPPRTWQGIFDAYWDAPACIQRGANGEVAGSEDCLALNVFVPRQANVTHTLPVMVWIHGGGFIAGSGPVGPQYLVNKEVIVVSLNYRLGAFGFLCLGVKEAPGNAGLKDQLAALRWVRENIRSFGGDADSITLFGESAGAASVSAHMVSPASSGLFHRAITESGTVIDSWALDPYHFDRARQMAQILGTDTEDPNDIVKVLTSATAEDLLRATELVLIAYITLVPVAPCIEVEIQGVEPFLTQDPYTTLISGNYSQVPWLNGFNNQEGLMTADVAPLESIESRYEQYLPADLSFKTEEDRRVVANVTRAFYFGSEPIDDRSIQKVVDYTTDIYFLYGAWTATALHAAVSAQPVYFYEFAYDGGRNYAKQALEKLSRMPGASHADEVFYLFDPFPSSPDIGPEDSIIVDRMTTMWTNFAKYGSPTPESPTPLLPVAWPPANATHANCLVIASDMALERAPYAARMQLWDDVYGKYRRNYLN